MKSYELLKELLLLRKAGSYNMLDNSISLAIDLYCEESKNNRDSVINSLKVLYNLVWDGYWKDLNSWDKRQTMYKDKLNNMEVA